MDDALPIFVTVASHDEAVLAYGHYEELPDALAWIARAMVLLPEAKQMVIAKTAVVDWLAIGRLPKVTPADGWKRDDEGWYRAHPDDLQMNHNEFAPGPSVLVPDLVDFLSPGRPPAPFADWRAAVASAAGVLDALSHELDSEKRKKSRQV